MGLDIYLYRYENFEETRRKEDLQSQFTDKLWEEAGEYDDLTDEQKEEIRRKSKENAVSLGLDENEDDKENVQRVEMDHPDYPDHYFKIGYFRSSYNEGGIERILKNLDLPTLHDVFLDGEDQDYYVKPDWQKALEKVESLISEFQKKGAYRVRAVYPEKFGGEIPKSESEALKIFEEEVARHPNSDYNYSNGKGEFFFAHPEKILAMIPGQNRYIFNDRPCIFVVSESDNTWYINALKIVKETCEFVLAKEDKDKYYLHWSG